MCPGIGNRVPFYIMGCRAVSADIFTKGKQYGRFFILYYNEFLLQNMPLYIRVTFKIIECPYAFDFIRRDWREILKDFGFQAFHEHLFF